MKICRERLYEMSKSKISVMKSLVKGGSTDERADRKLDLSRVKVEPLFEDVVDFDTFSKSDFRVVKVLKRFLRARSFLTLRSMMVPESLLIKSQV